MSNEFLNESHDILNESESDSESEILKKLTPFKKPRPYKDLLKDVESLVIQSKRQISIIQLLRDDLDFKKLQLSTISKERDELKRKVDKLEKEIETYGKLIEKLQGYEGGRVENKRIKNVSQRSTASHHHATRRHASQRKKSGTLRRVQR